MTNMLPLYDPDEICHHLLCIEDINTAIAKRARPSVFQEILNRSPKPLLNFEFLPPENILKKAHTEIPLMHAIETKQLDVALLLLKHGARSDCFNRTKNSIMCAIHYLPEILPTLIHQNPHHTKAMYKINGEYESGEELILAILLNAHLHDESNRLSSIIQNLFDLSYDPLNVDLGYVLEQIRYTDVLLEILKVLGKNNVDFTKIDNIDQLIEENFTEPEIVDILQCLFHYNAPIKYTQTRELLQNYDWVDHIKHAIEILDAENSRRNITKGIKKGHPFEFDGENELEDKKRKI